MNTHSSSGSTHVLPLRVYVGVWAALLVLTVVTVAVSRVDLGAWNVLVALVVAAIKAMLVALFFMHLRYDNKFNLLILVASLGFVAIFFVPTLLDVSSRSKTDPISAVDVAGYNQRYYFTIQKTPLCIPHVPAATSAGHQPAATH